MRILVVEDDRKAAQLVSKSLRDDGFLVDIAHSSEDGAAMASAEEYAAIVLDRLLTGQHGLTLCRDLRGRGVWTPILMLTARRSADDCVAALNEGADDCLAKPFALSELLARLRALLRRSALARPMTLTVADLSLDPARHEVIRAGTPINLTPKEFALLEVLMRHPGVVLTRTTLGERVWRDEDDVNNLVDVHVSRLRRKIDGESTTPLIQTVWGRGYRLGPLHVDA
jgi:DNA-binding response OmpR family regulator